MNNNCFRLFVIISVITFLTTACFAQDEPSLPAGLGAAEESAVDEPALPLPLGLNESNEPALPAGLGLPTDDDSGSEPSLPAGLFGSAEDEDQPEHDSGSPDDAGLGLTGFWETRVGTRLKDDHYEKETSILEARLQLEFERPFKSVLFNFTGDLLYDHPVNRDEIVLEEGKGWFDLRAASFSLSLSPETDLKIGRQVLTWGTGDMLFINDLFPKDWNSFFIGRDDEYLKAPSDAVKISIYKEFTNIDFVYTPRFDPDRFIDGSRISYWNGTLGRRAGTDAVVAVEKPDRWENDHEIALRLFKNMQGDEWALYAYQGYWKSPRGQNAATGKATYPELFAYGFSYRGAMGQGIGSLESGYYDSEGDRGGDNPFIKNSEFRFLAGYEQELAKNVTGSFQYYCEYMMDYGEYLASLPAGARAAHEYRHLVSFRLTRLMWDQNLTLSLFTYFSPSESDAYFRPKVHYKMDDNRALEIGANLFTGDYDHTFFGQFHHNSNVYVAYRYSF